VKDGSYAAPCQETTCLTKGLPDISHKGISEWCWAPSSMQGHTGFTETAPVIETRALHWSLWVSDSPIWHTLSSHWVYLMQRVCTLTGLKPFLCGMLNSALTTMQLVEGLEVC